MYNINGSDGKRKLNETQIQKMENDKLKLNFATEKNFRVIYIWEQEIKNGDFSKL